jgi:Domain of unknown function (DUF4920)
MKRAALAFLISIFSVGCTQSGMECCADDATAAKPHAVEPKYTSFGAPATRPTEKTVAVSAVMSDAQQYSGKYLSLTGTVASVCPKKGCWLTLSDQDSKPMFIKFTCPVDGRLIPMEAVGRPAVVEGLVKVVTLSETEARHYKEDAGASQEEIEKIVGPQTQITVMSPAAKIADLPKAQ